METVDFVVGGVVVGGFGLVVVGGVVGVVAGFGRVDEEAEDEADGAAREPAAGGADDEVVAAALCGDDASAVVFLQPARPATATRATSASPALAAGR